MPIHDWTRVDAGTFHSHHLGWMAALSGALNNGRLPPGFYSMTGYTTAGGEPPPSADVDKIDELAFYVARRRRVTIFREPEDRPIARVEMVTAADRRSPAAMDRVAGGLLDSAACGLAVLAIDPFPTVPGERGLAAWLGVPDPAGRPQPAGRQVTFAVCPPGERSAWSMSHAPLGGPLPDVVLPLEAGTSVAVPLEVSYARSFEGMPRHLIALLQRPA